MSANASLGAYGVMYVVQNKKSDVLGLLLRNGVVVPSDASDITIALAVTNLLKVSKTFYNEFSKLLVNKDVVYGMSANMSGSYENMSGSYANAIGDSAFCQDKTNKQFFPSSYKSACEGSSTFDASVFNTSTKDTKPKDTSGTPSWLNTGLNLLQTGFAGYLQLDDNKTKRELADASVRLSESGQVGGTSNDGTPPPKGLGTGAIIGLSILGVSVVGLIVYLVTKKK